MREGVRQIAPVALSLRRSSPSHPLHMHLCSSHHLKTVITLRLQHIPVKRARVRAISPPRVLAEGLVALPRAGDICVSQSASSPPAPGC